MTILARDVAKKVENEMDYPGQIKVNVIRETRIVDYAKQKKVVTLNVTTFFVLLIL